MRSPSHQCSAGFSRRLFRLVNCLDTIIDVWAGEGGLLPCRLCGCLVSPSYSTECCMYSVRSTGYLYIQTATSTLFVTCKWLLQKCASHCRIVALSHLPKPFTGLPLPGQGRRTPYPIPTFGPRVPVLALVEVKGAAPCQGLLGGANYRAGSTSLLLVNPSGTPGHSRSIIVSIYPSHVHI